MHPLITPYYSEVLGIYSKDQPEFLLPFFESKTVQRLSDISQSCGLEYSGLFNRKQCSRLDHSLWVALIIWNHTHDQKQTLAWLFHDISHTVFSHAWDFLLWDVENQESSELYTSKLLRDDPIIQDKLRKLEIDLEEVDCYERYPVADNPGPQLAADRLEYTLGTPIQLWTRTITEIREIYEDIVVLKNEKGADELGFKTVRIAEKFWLLSIENDESCFASYESIVGMSFVAEILRCLIDEKIISHMDLYLLCEKDVIKIIQDSSNQKLKRMWEFYVNLSTYKVDRYRPTTHKYCVSSRCKKRYIDPIIQTDNGNIRLSALSDSFTWARDYHLSRKEEWITLDYIY